MLRNYKPIKILWVLKIERLYLNVANTVYKSRETDRVTRKTDRVTRKWQYSFVKLVLNPFTFR